MKTEKEKIVECRCSDCAKLCKGHPGRFGPGQATKAAKYLGLSLPQFFKKYLTIDYYVGDGDKTKDQDILSPAWNNNNGKRAKFSDAFSDGNCALLTEEGCKLSLDLRPIECAVTLACKEDSPDFSLTELAKEWDNPEGSEELQEVKASLYG